MEGHEKKETGNKRTHCQLLNELLNDLETGDLPWYERASERNNYAWHTAVGVAILASVLSTVIAGLIRDGQFEGVWRFLMIVLPAIGTVATGFLNAFKFREKEAMREEGRIEMLDIIREGRSLQADSGDEAKCKLNYDTIRKRVDELDRAQNNRDAALRRDQRSPRSGGRGE